MSVATVEPNSGEGNRTISTLVHPAVWLVFLFLVTSTQVDATTPLAQALALPGYLVITALDLFEIVVVPLDGVFWPALVVLCYAVSVALVAAYRNVI